MVIVRSVIHKYSTYARTAFQDLDSLGWNISPRPRVAYIGWLGRGNLGDEAMYLSHRQRLPPNQTLPKAPINGWSRQLASMIRKPSAEVLLVGGGTVLGHRAWLKSLTEAREALAPQRFIVLGAGMEDIDFALNNGLATKQTLRDWALLLNKADFVGVRGPRSQKHLWRIGVDSQVVGDAALWFDCPLSPPNNARVDRKLPYVAINVVGRSSGSEPHQLKRAREILNYARGLRELGLGVVFFGMERRDIQEARRLRDSLPSVQVMRWTNSVARVARIIMRSELVVAERLHGTILAAAFSKPFLMLPYKPKSYDFAESVGALDSCIAPESLSTECLMERTLAQMSNGDTGPVDDAKSNLAKGFDAAYAEWVSAR